MVRATSLALLSGALAVATAQTQWSIIANNIGECTRACRKEVSV